MIISLMSPDEKSMCDYIRRLHKQFDNTAFLREFYLKEDEMSYVKRCRNCHHYDQFKENDDPGNGLCRLKSPFVEVNADNDWCSEFSLLLDACDRANAKIKELRETVKV